MHVFTAISTHKRLADTSAAILLFCALVAAPAAAQQVTSFEKVGVVVAIDGSELVVRTDSEDEKASRFYLPPEVIGNVKDSDGRRVTLRPGLIVGFMGERTVNGRTVERIQVIREAERERSGEARQ